MAASAPADGDVPMGRQVQVSGIGSPPPVQAEIKVERMKFKAKVLNVISGATMAAVSVPTVYFGPDGTGCNRWLIRTIYLWTLFFGLLLIAAELELPLVKEHFHFLAFRSGRAFLMIFMGSISLTAAIGEVPISYAAPGVVGPGNHARVLISVSWPLCALTPVRNAHGRLGSGCGRYAAADPGRTSSLARMQSRSRHSPRSRSSLLDPTFCDTEGWQNPGSQVAGGR